MKRNSVFYVTKSFTFDSAHKLVKYKGKCEELHGHTYLLHVTVKGTLNEEDMVIDFSYLKKIVYDNVLSILDHYYLNNILEQPSTENLAFWIWRKLEKHLDTQRYKLYEIKICETPTSCIVFRGELEI